MASNVSYVFPNIVRYTNYRFRPLHSCLNLTCSRYYVIDNNDKDSSLESKTDKKETNKQFTKSVTSNKSTDAAKKKLLDLLSDIKVSPQFSKDKMPPTNINLTRPLPPNVRKEKFIVPTKLPSSPQDILKSAVKKVASNLKGDSTTIELELTDKLNTLNISKENLESLEQETEVNEEPAVTSIISEEAKEKIMSSVKDVASTVPEDQQPIQSELAKRLLQFATEGKSSEEQKKTLLNLFDGLKVEKKRPVEEIDETHRPTSQRQDFKTSRRAPVLQKVDLFTSPPLNVFKLQKEEIRNEERNVLWEKLKKNELRLLVQYAPSNAFEEMIMWTEQGKHWKFPIDNDADMGAEENVGFQEHVFLDHHLEGFPTTGPIRHFMELVVTGLSKNPYISVERKVENIEWFRQYFKEKEHILQELEAVS